MTHGRSVADSLVALDSLDVAVVTDDVSDNYVSKTPFAVSEFSNVVKGGASVISGDIITPHCTGWRALRALANAFPEAVSQSAVGTTYTFSADRAT